MTSAVDKCTENKMSLISQEINTAPDIIKDTRLQANEERDVTLFNTLFLILVTYTTLYKLTAVSIVAF